MGVPFVAAQSTRARILCLTGSESTGKTTLAGELAKQLRAYVVPEFARTYLAGRAEYSLDDVRRIARGQAALERAAVLRSSGVIVCDTDLLVIAVWCEVKYGRVPAEVEMGLRNAPSRLYLLTAPDLPWEDDPLRESGGARDALHARYLRRLARLKRPFTVVSGQGETRINRAMDAAHAWLR